MSYSTIIENYCFGKGSWQCCFSFNSYCPNNSTVAWLQSTLLLKIESWETHTFILKHNVYKESEHSIIWDGKVKEKSINKRVKL
jgi:hypothetical protein